MTRLCTQLRDCAIEAQATPSGPGKEEQGQDEELRSPVAGRNHSRETGKISTTANAITTITPVVCRDSAREKAVLLVVEFLVREEP
jgi:hypothetical protein